MKMRLQMFETHVTLMQVPASPEMTGPMVTQSALRVLYLNIEVIYSKNLNISFL